MALWPADGATTAGDPTDPPLLSMVELCGEVSLADGPSPEFAAVSRTSVPNRLRAVAAGHGSAPTAPRQVAAQATSSPPHGRAYLGRMREVPASTEQVQPT